MDSTPSDSGGSKKITKKAFADLENRCASLERQNKRLEDHLAAKATLEDKKLYEDLIDDINNLLEEAIESVGFRTDGSIKSDDAADAYIPLSAKKIQEKSSQLNEIEEIVREGLESLEEDPRFDDEHMENHIQAFVDQIWDLKGKVGEIERIPDLEEDARIQCDRADDFNRQLQQERVKSTQLEQDNSQSQAGLREAQRLYHEQEGRIARLENTIRDRDTTISQQSALISHAESSIGTYTSTIRDLEARLSQNDDSTKGVEERYQAELHRMMKQHNTEMEGLRAEVCSLQRRLEEQTKLHEGAMRQKEQEKKAESCLKDHFALEKIGLEKAVSKLRDEIGRLIGEKEGTESKFGTEKAELQMQLLKLYSENEASEEMKRQLKNKHDIEMKAAKESIAELESHCISTGEAEPSIIANIRIRRLEAENKNLRDTKGQLQEMVAALKKEYQVRPGKLSDIMNVQKNSSQWRKDIQKAQHYAISAKEARQQTMELNRGLNEKLGQLISENQRLKREKESLERDIESKSWEIARKDKETTRQTNENTRLAADLRAADNEAQRLRKQHESIGGTVDRLAMATKELNDKQAIFDHETKTLESARKELKRIQDREYAFLTSEEYAVRTSKKIESLEKENKRLEGLSQRQKKLSELDEKLIARLRSDKPLVVHTPPSAPAISRDTVLKLMKEPDHNLPRLTTATSLSHAFSPIVTIMNIEPVPAVAEKVSYATPLISEARNSEDAADLVDSGLFPDTENNEVGGKQARAFPKWEFLFIVLIFLGTLVSTAMNPHVPKTGLSRGNVCELFEKPLEQSFSEVSTMVCAGSADDYANLSIHDFNVQNGAGTTLQ